MIISTLNEYLNNFNYIKVIPRKYLYHTSNPIFRTKISRDGLIPQGKSESWLTTTKINNSVIFAINSDSQKDRWDSGYDDDIYRIDTSNLQNKWFIDPNFEGDDRWIFTFEPIPLEALTLIYKGTGQSLG